MFKVKTGCAPDIMKETLEIYNRNYNFQHDFLIKRITFDRHIAALKHLLLLAQKKKLYN